MTKKRSVLILIDLQNDFITGSLANTEAQKIVPDICEFIEGWKGSILCTQDIHEDNYLKSNEGKHLPIEHCIRNSGGQCIDDRILKALRGHRYDVLEKSSFGTIEWERFDWLKNYQILICGICTDICVISNALILKSIFPEADIEVLSNLCAGSTPEMHEAALKVMNSCQIDTVDTNTVEFE